MNTTLLTSWLGRVLEPLANDLTPECAARILTVRTNEVPQARLDDLVKRYHEGKLTPDEVDEYTSFVHAVCLVDVIQAKARVALARSPSVAPAAAEPPP